MRWIEKAVDVGLGYGGPVDLRAFQGDAAIEAVDALSLDRGSGCAFAAGQLGNTGNGIADGGDGAPDLADPLSGQVLKRAGLENGNRLPSNFF